MEGTNRSLREEKALLKPGACCDGRVRVSTSWSLWCDLLERVVVDLRSRSTRDESDMRAFASALSDHTRKAWQKVMGLLCRSVESTSIIGYLQVSGQQQQALERSGNFFDSRTSTARHRASGLLG